MQNNALKSHRHRYNLTGTGVQNSVLKCHRYNLTGTGVQNSVLKSHRYRCAEPREDIPQGGTYSVQKPHR